MKTKKTELSCTDISPVPGEIRKTLKVLEFENW